MKRLFHIYYSGEDEKGDAIVERLIKSHPRTPIAARAAYRRADRRRKRKDFTSADADYQMAIKYGSKDVAPGASLAWARCLRRRGQYERAESVLRALLDRWPLTRAAAWATRVLRSMREVGEITQPPGKTFRSILEAMVDHPDTDLEERLDTLWRLFQDAWDPPNRKQRKRAEGYAQRLRKLSRPQSIHGKHRHRTSKAMQALKRGVSTYDLRGQKEPDPVEKVDPTKVN